MKPDELITKFFPESLRPYAREPFFDLDEIRAHARTNEFAIPALLQQRVAYWCRRLREEARLPAHGVPFAAPVSTTAIPLSVYEACASTNWRPR